MYAPGVSLRRCSYVLGWSPLPGLNWRPRPYQGRALPTELRGRYLHIGCRLFIPTGAGNGIRTRDIQLGRLTLYQLSYSRVPFIRRTRYRLGRRLTERGGGGWIRTTE